MLTLQPQAASVPALLTRYAAPVSEHLRATAPASTSMTGLMAAYHMGWIDRGGRPLEAPPGKLVRPSLCLWACEAFGTAPDLALPLAAAVEWVHNFTLVHDDIQDGDRERRHRETVWSIWGQAQGINAGDALHAIAFELLLAPGPLPDRRLRAGHTLARAVRQVVEGQSLDLALEGRLGAGPTAYLRMARAKTGALLGASLEAGAVVGGAAVAVARRLRRAGELLGLAFQVRDDWLGIWGEPAQTGKSRDCDLGRRKVTYPVVAGFAAMAPPVRRRLRTLFLQSVPLAAQPPAPAGTIALRAADDDVAEMRALLESCGAGELTETAARRFAEEAIAIAARCGLPPTAFDEFEEFARYVANRSR